MNKYLLLRFSSLGDVVLATSAARLIRGRRPDARVVFATKAAFAPVLAGQQDIDEVWALRQGESLAALVSRVRAAKFDAVVDLHSGLRARALGLLSGAPVRRWKSQGLNRRLRVHMPFMAVPLPEPVHTRFARAAAAALGEALGEGPAPLPRLGLDPAAAAWAGDWLKAQGLMPGQKLLAVAPGAAWATKRWGVDHMAQCLDLVSEFDKVRFLLLGSAAEGPLLDSLQAAMRKSRPMALRSDRETGDLGRLAALIARSDLFLGHDSGPMHVADALGVPVTVLFGPTVEAFGFYPLGAGRRVFERDLDCRPCSVHGTASCPLGHHDCMKTIEPFGVALHLRRGLGLEKAAA
ncbi:MAG TPA: glycosyltransferase family 9 protein [bacterium]|jgi:heptosyltransferase-2|nr:glycosyltransferase family 9 protein [bacterium]